MWYLGDQFDGTRNRNSTQFSAPAPAKSMFAVDTGTFFDNPSSYLPRALRSRVAAAQNGLNQIYGPAPYNSASGVRYGRRRRRMRKSRGRSGYRSLPRGRWRSALRRANRASRGIRGRNLVRRGRRTRRVGTKTALNPQYSFQKKARAPRGNYQPPLGRLKPFRRIANNAEDFSVKYVQSYSQVAPPGTWFLSVDAWASEVFQLNNITQTPFLSADFYRAMEGWEEFTMHGYLMQIEVLPRFAVNDTLRIENTGWSVLKNDFDPHATVMGQFGHTFVAPVEWDPHNESRLMENVPSYRVERFKPPYADTYAETTRIPRPFFSRYCAINKEAPIGSINATTYNQMGNPVVPGGARSIDFNQRDAVMRYALPGLVNGSNMNVEYRKIVTCYFTARTRTPLANLTGALASIPVPAGLGLLVP